MAQTQLIQLQFWMACGEGSGPFLCWVINYSSGSHTQASGVGVVQCTRIRQYRIYLRLINGRCTCFSYGQAIKPIKSLEWECGDKTPSAVCFTRGVVGTIWPAILNTFHVCLCVRERHCLNVLYIEAASGYGSILCNKSYIWGCKTKPGKCLICS